MRLGANNLCHGVECLVHSVHLEINSDVTYVRTAYFAIAPFVAYMVPLCHLGSKSVLSLQLNEKGVAGYLGSGVVKFVEMMERAEDGIRSTFPSIGKRR